MCVCVCAMLTNMQSPVVKPGAQTSGSPVSDLMNVKPAPKIKNAEVNMVECGSSCDHISQ